MNLYFRLLLLIVRRLFWRGEIKVDDICETQFRVGLFDLDLNFHMNNGRFFSVMDLGRLDLMLKTKKLFSFFRQGYYPLVLSETMGFKKSLQLFDHYTLQTKVECWDDKFFYFTQKFIKNNETYSSASVRVCFKQRGRKGLIPSYEILEFFQAGHLFNKDKTLTLTNLASQHIQLDSIILPHEKKNEY